MRTILFADNDKDFLDTRCQFLEAEGYQVRKAYSLGEATSYINNHRFHLIILDIRLENDDDEKDISGLILAKDQALRSIPKIILTNFPSYQFVREVMGPVHEGYPSALDFLAKEEGAEALVNAVNKSFSHHISIGWNLIIKWNEKHPLSFAHLAGLIETSMKSEILNSRSEEFEDLIRKLFINQEQITIDRLLWRGNERAALVIFGFAADKPTESFVVIYGIKSNILNEYQLYKNHAPIALETTVADKSTLSVISELSETFHFAAYTLTGAPLESAVTLSEFYRSSPDQKSIRSFIESFRETNDAWSRGEQTKMDSEITEPEFYYKLIAPDEFRESDFVTLIRSVEIEAAKHNIILNVGDQSFQLQITRNQEYTFPNPWNYLSTLLSMQNTAVMCVSSPGMVAPGNLLIAKDGRVWFTDFNMVGLTPLAWSYATLEAAIRFELVETDNLADLHEMERRLTNPANITLIDTKDVSASIRKALQFIQSLRRSADTTIIQYTRSYHLSLFFHAMNQVIGFEPGIRPTRREFIQVIHGLLAAGMIITQNLQADRESVADEISGLSVNKREQEVRLDGEVVKLTPTEYKLIIYLYDHPERLCSYKDIIEFVWGISYNPNDTDQRGNLDTTVGRVREKIERDRFNPHHLITERGRGFRFYRRPKQ